jgi:hypothetical protein
MSGVSIEQLVQLGEPTPTEEIKKRPIFNKAKEKVGELDYVDARFTMDRFDTVCGPAFWQDEYRVTEGGIIGRIGVLIEGVGWVWKEDVGTESTIEETKGAFSDAFKRTAVKWGVARDLYDTRDGQTGRGPKPAAGQSTTQVRAATSKPTSFPVPVESAPWVCPQHQGVVAWPAGVTAAGRKYDAFYACPTGRDCTHRAPHGLKVNPAHLQIAVARPADDLPF